MKAGTTLITIALLVFITGCSKTGGSSAPFTTEEFQKLRWLEGTWRGSDAGGGSEFFERIRFVRTDRIEIDSLSDASSGTVTGQSSIEFSVGSIFHQNGGVIWEATKLTDTTVEFAPKTKTANPFTWEKVSADAWIATMAGKDAHANATQTVYKMERIR